MHLLRFFHKRGYESTVLQQILHRQPDVFGDLAHQDGRNIASRVERNGSAPAISVPQLFVRAALTKDYCTAPVIVVNCPVDNQ